MNRSISPGDNDLYRDGVTFIKVGGQGPVKNGGGNLIEEGGRINMEASCPVKADGFGRTRRTNEGLQAGNFVKIFGTVIL